VLDEFKNDAKKDDDKQEQNMSNVSHPEDQSTDQAINVVQKSSAEPEGARVSEQPSTDKNKDKKGEWCGTKSKSLLE